ncbi:MAG: CRTAC1 family protein [Phycisphaerales bacterium]|nr:CRTAC1 family protein [Phycisphaerales bacterium]
MSRLRRWICAMATICAGMGAIGLVCDGAAPASLAPPTYAGADAFRDVSAVFGEAGRIRGWGGVALFDYDNDDDVDILLLNGAGVANRLFQNDGSAGLADVAEAAGVQMIDDECAAAGVGDFNNDGRLDLVIGRQRIGGTGHDDAGPALLLNQGPDGNGVVTFHRTSPAETGFDSSAPAMAFGVGDLDNDGLLDIVVGRYDIEAAGSLLVPIYESQPNELWRCTGVTGDSPRFERVESAGIEGTAQHGWSADTETQMFIPGTFALYISDVDGDGLSDILDCHDIPGGIDYFHNDGGLNFSRRQADVLNKHGGWMGISGGDYDNDGDIDYFVTNVGADFPTAFLPGTVGNAHNAPDGAYFHKLLRNDSGTLTDVTAETVVKDAGQLAPWNAKGGMNLARYEFGFGATWFDADNRGRLDLYWSGDLMSILTPTLYLNAHGVGRFLQNAGDGTFVERTGERGLFNIPSGREISFGRQEAARSVAAVDLNGDGYRDVVVSSGSIFGGPAPQLRALLNPATGGGRWLNVRLKGVASNRFGIGARVRVERPGNAQTREIVSTNSAFLGVQPMAHFGLGESDDDVTVVVNWPSGKTTTLAGVKVDQTLTIEEE